MRTRIKYYRTKLSLTQEQLADQVGIARTQVNKWETGQVEPSLKWLEKMAVVLGVSVTDLIVPQTIETQRAEGTLDMVPEVMEAILTLRGFKYLDTDFLFTMAKALNEAVGKGTLLPVPGPYGLYKAIMEQAISLCSQEMLRRHDLQKPPKKKKS